MFTNRDSTPEALTDWQPREPFLKRLSRAVSIPITAGAVVLAIGVLISIAMLWFTPHQSHSVSPATLVDSRDVQDEVILPTDVDTADESGPSNDVAPVSDASSDVLVVHVVGEVIHPGVVTLRAGDRVEAAIESAGGATDEAVLDVVNLARTVSDGEQIVVPNAEQADSVSPGSDVAADIGGAGARQLVNVNTANVNELETLQGIGPALAQRIIEYRETNGAFEQDVDLLEISGIGAKKFEEIRDDIRVS